MSLLEAIFMGIIQGLTEFLPVSSSGHLAIFKSLFGIHTETGILFDVLLHFATLLSVCAVFYKDIAKLITEGFAILKYASMNLVIFFHNMILLAKNQLGKKSSELEEMEFGSYHRIITSSYRKFVVLIIVSIIPTGIIGIIGKNTVEMSSKLLIVPGVCLLITSLLLFVADFAKEGEKLPKDVCYSNAFLIGTVQGIATLPGISRSGATITACLLSGFQRNFAVKYSFIMSIPAILGAMILELKEFSFSALGVGEVVNYVIGMIFAAIVGYICIKTMLYVVKKKKFKGFAIYCLIMGLIAIVGHFYMI